MIRKWCALVTVVVSLLLPGRGEASHQFVGTRSAPYDRARICVERAGFPYNRDCFVDPPAFELQLPPNGAVIGATARSGWLPLGGVGGIGTPRGNLYSAKVYESWASILFNSGAAGGNVVVTANFEEISRVAHEGLRDQILVCLLLSANSGEERGRTCIASRGAPTSITVNGLAYSSETLMASFSVSALTGGGSEGFDGEALARLKSFSYSVGF